MFKSIAEARKVLSATFDVTHVDMLIAALQPTIAFHPDIAGSLPALGATRIGGTPDLARDTAWPIRAVPANLEEIAARGGTAHRDHIEKHLRRALPFEFLAQVDLAEAARLGPVASSLPSEGRLLFFNDGAIGPWHSGPEMCRVMWDRTPAGDLLRQPLPQGLIELSEDYIREANEAARKDGWSQQELAPPYWGPARAMRLVHEFRLPHYSSVEARLNTSLAAALLDDDFASRYQGHFDAFWSKESKASRHQLLGGPIPEQDDPRYDAVIGEDAVFGGGSFEITPAHIALLRQMRICWEGAERGAPMLDPSAPYGRADLLAQLAEGFALDDADLLARRHVEMYFVLARALKHGALEPGTYTLMNIDPDNVRRMMQGYGGTTAVLDEALGLNADGSVTITDEHVTLIRHIEVIWPSPSESDERIDLGDYPAAACDPKRPYGNHTFIEVDMARILGCLPSLHEGARDEDLAAFEPEPDLAGRLQHLHWQMLVAIQVFVERARLAPGAYSM